MPLEMAFFNCHVLQTFSWASVTSKNLPPSGSVTTGVTPHVVKAPSSQVRCCNYDVYHDDDHDVFREVSSIVNNTCFLISAPSGHQD